MSILVTGATGTIGSLIVQGLARQGANVKALVRKVGKAAFPAGVTEVVGDLTDVGSLRQAFVSVRTLFLLNAVTPDEVTQAMLALNLAREAGIERIVYLSVIHADLYCDVPHFAGKSTVERMIDSLELPATILRPAYFMQNDGQLRALIEAYGVYPMPIGAAGVAMVDTRDIADVAVAELLRRDRALAALPRVTLELAGPDALTGAAAAAIWSETLQRKIVYGGDDLAAFEAQMANHAPTWMAYDMRLMMARIQQHGMAPAAGTKISLEELLGRPLHSYRDMVGELAAPPDVPQAQQFVDTLRAEYRATIPMTGTPDPVGHVLTLAIPATGPAREIPARLYTPVGADGQQRLPIIVFAHGGGFISGDLDTHDVLVRTIANRAHALVLSVDYRLAPEHPFPAGLEDVYAALQWAATNAEGIGGDPTRIAVCGDSAGGNLAAATTLLARERRGPRLAAQWLMYPMLGTQLANGSWQKYGATHFPTREATQQIIAAYVPSDVFIDNPLVAPLGASHHALPKALVQLAEFDPLQDEGRDYASRLAQEGIEAHAIVYAGQVHGFMQYYKDQQNHSRGEAAIDEGIAFLQAAFNSKS